MALNKVEICGVNTAKLPLLKEEEKEELFARIKEGDEEAKEKYIKGNLRLVLSVIKRFAGSNENPDDLFQIGCIGLIKAVNNFNTELDVRFSTYAVPMIIGEIRRYMRDNNSIRVSRSLRDTAYKAIYAKENYVKKNLREPTVQEISEEIGIAKEDIVFALDAIQAPVSLNEPVYNDSGDALYVMDQISDKKNKEERWIEDLSLPCAPTSVWCWSGKPFFRRENPDGGGQRSKYLPGSGEQTGKKCAPSDAAVSGLRKKNACRAFFFC